MDRFRKNNRNKNKNKNKNTKSKKHASIKKRSDKITRRRYTKKKINGGFLNKNEWKVHTYDNLHYQYTPEMNMARKQSYPNSMQQFVGEPSFFYLCH